MDYAVRIRGTPLCAVRAIGDYRARETTDAAVVLAKPPIYAVRTDGSSICAVRIIRPDGPIKGGLPLLHLCTSQLPLLSL